MGVAAPAVFITVADIFGLVVTDRHLDCFLECARGTNNTGEIRGIIQALLWLLHCDMEDDNVGVIKVTSDTYERVTATDPVNTAVLGLQD